MTLLLDYIDGFIVDFRGTNGFTSAVSTLSTLVGAFVVLLCGVKVLIAAHQGFRLYVLRQFCCNTNNTRKYGQWAIVTGAANGIGRSMARELARRGHSIVAIDIDQQNLIASKALFESEPNVGQVDLITADLSDTSLENYARLERQLQLDSREIGILINNAGLANNKHARFGRFEMEAIRRTINVNVLATAFMTRIVLPQMAARRRGLILNMSSVLADKSLPSSGVYGSTKAFVSEFSRFLKLEYCSSHQVDIVYLTPSAVKTHMLDVSSVKLPAMVAPDYFARSALNALGAGINSYSGCWEHGVFRLIYESFKNLGLLPATYAFLDSRAKKGTTKGAKDKSRIIEVDSHQ